MEFASSEILRKYLLKLNFLSCGSQGSCFVDLDKKYVYKIFNSFLADEENPYFSYEDIMKFSNVKNGTFIWPLDVIKVNKMIVGYMLPFKNAKDIFSLNPLSISLNSLKCYAERAYKDIKILSKNNIKIYDLMYNLLLGDDGLYVIDTLECSYGRSSFKDNQSTLDFALKRFIVDGFFDNVVFEDKILEDMYFDKYCSFISFADEFAKRLSSQIGKPIDYLSDALSLSTPSSGKCNRTLKKGL